jgi:hypothetical protein
VVNGESLGRVIDRRRKFPGADEGGLRFLGAETLEKISALRRSVCILSRWLAEAGAVAAEDAPSPVLARQPQGDSASQTWVGSALELAANTTMHRGFFPADLAKLYEFPEGDGAGQSIGILEFGGGFLPGRPRIIL